MISEKHLDRDSEETRNLWHVAIVFSRRFFLKPPLAKAAMFFLPLNLNLHLHLNSPEAERVSVQVYVYIQVRPDARGPEFTARRARA